MGRTIQRISLVTPFNIAPGEKGDTLTFYSHSIGIGGNVTLDTEHFDMTIQQPIADGGFCVFRLPAIYIELRRQFFAPHTHDVSFRSCYMQAQVERLTERWADEVEVEKRLLDRACEADTSEILLPLHVDLYCEQVIV